MMNVLIVDDEKIFLKSLTEGLSTYAAHFNVLTAENGRDAIKALESMKIELVVTDLKMPEMNGFELLAYINQHFPKMPVIVMTAYGTPVIEDRLRTHAVHLMEKPLEINALAETILVSLAENSRGFLHGVTLPAFLQLVEMEKKTYTLKVKAAGKEGFLYFVKGVLFDAETKTLSGVEAAQDILCWEDVEIEIEGICKKKTNNIELPLSRLLMDSFRIKDEKENVKRRTPDSEEIDIEKSLVFESEEEDSKTKEEKEAAMGAKEKLQELSSIDGFAGAAVFTPTGELLAALDGVGSNFDPKTSGIMANNVLLNAQKASLEMGAGRGQLVHIQGEKAHFIVRCLNEGNDPLKSQPGKSHIHLVVVLSNDNSIGFAKLKASAAIEALADDFRL